MCATCGCSDHTGAAIVDVHGTSAPPVQAHTHAHEHHGPHEHAHTHGPQMDPRGARLVQLEHDVLAKNAQQAERNRGWFAAREIVALNLMSAPGAGKTTLLERTIRELDGVPVAVIEGDQATALDAARIRASGCRVVQINTGAGCHLDAEMVARALRQLDPPRRSVVCIENVGNLVCPALFDLGEQAKVVIMSVTEGEDKPLKYPHMFRAADLLLLNKVDLLPHLQFDLQRCIGYARQVNPTLQVMSVSAQRGDGLEAWHGWLRARQAADAVVE